MLFFNQPKSKLGETRILEAIEDIASTHTLLYDLDIPGIDPDTGQILTLQQRVRLLGLEMQALKRERVEASTGDHAEAMR